MRKQKMKRIEIAPEVIIDDRTSTAVRTACAIVGIGIVAGATLVIGMDRLMKKIFVGEDWPAEEWSNDDWAEEDLEA